MNSVNYRKMYILNFLQQWLFLHANHGAYSNPGTQVGALSKDFCAVLFADTLGRELVLFVPQANVN